MDPKAHRPHFTAHQDRAADELKNSPGERNGFFDSKVLSRQHAEVWEEGGKIFIKDVKSSNGTFINGERLSSEAHESDPFELKSDDIVEFGIDIVGEDNKTIIHHKVAARVVCVFSEQDAAVAARAEQHQAAAQQQQQQQLHQQQQQLHIQGGLQRPAAPPAVPAPRPAAGRPGYRVRAWPVAVRPRRGPERSGGNFPFNGGGATGPRRTQIAHAGLGAWAAPRRSRAPQGRAARASASTSS
ncbi:hypothetical protein BJ912DRAFT_860437 [Pholiota molesta]|nr:hypothetical protein BJ912DRAFT_860437 [Pholiota molesta]